VKVPGGGGRRGGGGGGGISTCRRFGSSQADAAEAVWRSTGAAGGAEAPSSSDPRQGDRTYRKVSVAVPSE